MTEKRKAGKGTVRRLDSGQVPKDTGMGDRDVKGRNGTSEGLDSGQWKGYPKEQRRRLFTT